MGRGHVSSHHLFATPAPRCGCRQSCSRDVCGAFTLLHVRARNFSDWARAGLAEARTIAENPALQRLLRGAGKLQLHRLLSTLVAAIQIAVVARFLSPQYYGLYALVLTTVQIVQGVLDVRCSELILRYYFQFLHAGERGKTAAVLLLGGLFEIGVGVLGAAGMIAAAGLLAPALLGADGSATWFTIAAFMPLSNLGGGLAAAILSVERSYGRLALADSVSTLAGFGALLVVLSAHPTVGALLGVALFTQAARGALRWHFVLRDGGEAKSLLFAALAAPSCLRELKADARELTRFAFSNNLTALLKVLQGTVPNVVIGLLSGPADVGYYFVGQRLGLRLSSFCSPIVEVAFREIAERRSLDPGGRGGRGLRHSVLLIGACVLPALIGIVVLGPWTIPLVFGPNYSDGIVPVQIVVAAYSCALVLNPIGALLLAEGWTSWINSAYALGLGVQLLAMWWWVPAWAATGAALALAAFFLATDAVLVWGWRRWRKGGAIR